MSNFIFQPKNLFSPSNPWEFLGFVILSYIIAICTAGSITLNIIGACGIALLFVLWWLYDRYRRNNYTVRLELRSPPPAKGLILLLSPYNILGQGRSEKLAKDLEFLSTSDAATKESDFDVISIEKSNLYPQIRAIEYHRSTLREVWLICSEESYATGHLLKEYIRVVHGPDKITVNHHPSFIVNPYFDDQLCRVADNIYNLSDIKTKAMIADITGGLATMSVSLAMACVAPGRRMQYTASPRKDNGEPDHSREIVPIELDFDPVLHWDLPPQETPTQNNQVAKR